MFVAFDATDHTGWHANRKRIRGNITSNNGSRAYYAKIANAHARQNCRVGPNPDTLSDVDCGIVTFEFLGTVVVSRGCNDRTGSDLSVFTNSYAAVPIDLDMTVDCSTIPHCYLAIRARTDVHPIHYQAVVPDTDIRRVNENRFLTDDRSRTYASLDPAKPESLQGHTKDARQFTRVMTSCPKQVVQSVRNMAHRDYFAASPNPAGRLGSRK